jgi:hypothetical protein
MLLVVCKFRDVAAQTWDCISFVGQGCTMLARRQSHMEDNLRERSLTTKQRFRVPMLFSWIAVAVMAAAISPWEVKAEVLVTGNPDSVEVRAEEARADEVLLALGKVFNVRYRTSAEMDRSITGTYRGTLQEVISRVLETYNFIVKNSPESIEVVVLSVRDKGSSLASTTPSATTLPAASPESPLSAEKSAPKRAETASRTPTSDGSALNRVVGAMAKQLQDHLDGEGPSRVPASSSSTPLISRPVTPADIVTLTQSATAQVDLIRRSLERLPR